MDSKVPENSEKDKISRRELLTLSWHGSDAPDGEAQGRVTLTGGRCTGCGLCTVDCSSGALSISSKETGDEFNLRFKANMCNACGRCVDACPEKCLSLERVPASGPADEVVLFGDTLVRCRQCGGVVGPRAMLDKVRATMLAAGQSGAQLELCPDCKARSQFNFNESPVRKR